MKLHEETLTIERSRGSQTIKFHLWGPVDEQREAYESAELDRRLEQLSPVPKKQGLTYKGE
jgi:hypothetical protein